MSYIGTGTRSSPIAIDDSEEEVVYALSKGSSSKSSPTLETVYSNTRRTTPEIIALDDLRDSQSMAAPLQKKRKRTNSFVSQDMPVAGPSRVLGEQKHNHSSLVNRLSQPQPESKKARKRRRKAERQALEEARLKNIDWLNNASQFAPPMQTYFSPHMHWPMDNASYNDPSFAFVPSMPTPMSSDVIFPRNFLSYNNSNPYQEEAMYKSRSPSPQLPDAFHPTPNLDPASSTSKWVSAMARAAESSSGSQNANIRTQDWSPISTEVPLPPAPPPPLTPPPLPPYSSVISKEPVTTELHHALPPKPPPPQPVPSIGMQPDQDPNSRHGIFQLAPCFKDVGVAAKKMTRKEQCTDQHIPNPARTLVMEKLPKTLRNADFVNRWGRSTSGALPLHVFIDGPSAKALIEFSTAELARKAWASPRLGGHYTGLKTHQLKGKPRVDLIKVWWYRVDGIGAGAGVGEIEEGEIEGDAAEREPDVSVPKKETKKERKARLAKEREEKRLVREVELKATKELQLQRDNQRDLSIPDPKITATLTRAVGDPLPQISKGALLNAHAPPFQPTPSLGNTPAVPSFGTFSWVQVPVHPPVNKTAFGSSLLLRDQGLHDDNESIASSVASSDKHLTALPIAKANADDHLSDFEEADMDMDDDIVVSPTPLIPAPPVLHRSLPPRPPPLNSMHTSRLVGHKPYTRLPPSSSSTVSSSIPQIPPRSSILPHHPTDLSQPSAHGPRSQSQNVPTHFRHTQLASGQPDLIQTVPLLTAEHASSSISVESKEIKQAPTEPSFTKRALLARQRELEEKIAKSKLELAAAAANKPSPHPVPSQPLPTKPASDLDDKHAMEVRLRNLVLQSQRAKANPVTKITSSESAATVSTPVSVDPPARPDSTSPTVPSTISVSAHHFSLEDLAVSFITQTIETVKAQPGSNKLSTPAPSVKPTPTNSRVKEELAARQRRLEEHISETKSLMTRISQSRSKEEKDILLKIMREKTRIYEEETKFAASTSASASSTPTPNPTPTPSSFSVGPRGNDSSSVMNKPQPIATTQQTHITRWPVNEQDAGVLMISDDEDEEEGSDDDSEL